MSTTDKQTPTPTPPPRLFPPPHPSLLRFFTQFKTNESKTYEMLIDTFRLRCDDDYTYGAHNHGVYGGDPPLPVFRDFLARAQGCEDVAAVVG